MGEEYFVTLRDVIKSYRQENNLSQRQFAINCSLSNGYISLLEKGINPKTKQPVTPTLPALKKLADGMCMTIMDLFAMVDDIPVNLGTEELDELGEVMNKELSALINEDGPVDRLDAEIISLILKLSPEKKKEALKYLRYLADYAEN